ncbi:MAG: carboxypeptidase regulatory-like domain-containing protein, partial [Verrucomicrobiales bacterium]|nr:carboxypeptidase regulatory-like domain-containing protein [Verrucomicrobiales bacterium]
MNACLRSWVLGALALALTLSWVSCPGAALTTLEYRIMGSRLRVTPETVTVPRHVAGSVLVQVVRGDGTVVPAEEAGFGGGRVEATLRGPSFPAQRLVAEPGQPLLLPPLRLAGDYQLDDVRWVQSGGTVVPATPGSIPVRVFDEVLVSRVTSRPLSSEEIREKGIVIDDTNFRVVEFEVALLLKGRTFQVRLPVVAPRVKLATEIIPVAELEERLVEAEQLNRELARSVSLPPEIRAEMPEFSLQPIQFEEVLDGEEEEKQGIPITGLLAIPGNIGFLNQFFSVQLFTENAAPEGSGLSVDQVRARIRLPQGPDGLPARSYEQPGDDPLRMARIGAGASVQTNLPVLLPGADGQRETEDDVSRLNPGQTGSAEFLVEGLREGLHLLEMDLEAELHGLAAGVVRVRGRAVGSVLVRNANFSMTFAHPQTVRVGEPYEAHVTLLNTGDVPAQATRISLNRLAISGAVLLSEETVELGDLAPGDSATATFRLRAQRTGSVYFSNLTTSDDSVRGRLNLTLGVDSRGVPLSPDVIVYPDWVQTLPRGVFDAANRVLGQALSVATAGRLPEGIRRVARVAVERHGVELAEAGQRLRYGDDPSRVLTDLLLDWQGARHQDLGFDQILRESDAGREWREAMSAAIDVLDTDTTVTRLRRLAPSLAGLGQSWRMSASGSSSWTITLTNLARTRGTSATASAMEGALVYHGLRGDWAVAPTNEPMVFVWTAAAGAPATTLTAFEVLPEGRVAWWRWEVPSPTAPVRYEFQPGRDQVLTGVDTLGTRHLDPVREVIHEEPPTVISVRQDISVVSDRAPLRCPIREYGNWGSVVAVLFSKPMTPEEAENAASYRLEESDNGARTVRLQPGGRIALLQLHRGIASFRVRPREYRLTVGSVPDPRGNRSVESRHDILTVPAKGTSVRGLVLGLDGLPVPGAPVTLTMTDRVGNKCVPVEYRAGQVFTDERGRFDLDFILADVAFTLGAIDTARMSEEDARAILSVLLEAARPASDVRQRVESLLHETSVKESMLRVFQSGDLAEAIAAAEGVDRATYTDYVSQDDARTGSELVVVLRFRGRGRVEGRVVDARGSPLPGAAVNLFPAVDSRELGRGVFADSEGWFRFEAVPLGEFSVETSTTDGRTRTVSGRLADPGHRETLEIHVPDVPVRTGVIAGWVTEDTGAAHVGARVFVARLITSAGADEVSGSVETDQDGAFRLQGIPEGPWMIVAVSSDGTRRTEVRSTSVTAGTSVDLQLEFERTAVVRGVVRLWEGTPAPRARVGGGSRVVVTDDQGRFELPGVPPGLRTLIAGLDGPDTPDGITRTASAQVRIQPGANDSVEFRLPARGRIRGVVYDASGERRVPGVRVSIPQPAGFLWVLANSNGEYEFNGLGLGGYLVSAPSPPVKVKADELASQAISALGEAQRGGSVDEAAALVGQLANLYAQGSLGRLTTTPFTPGSWGFNTTQIDYDGQTVVANVRYLPSGRLSGTVVNHQDVPIGAEVKVTAFGPTKNGGAGMVEIGPFGSDPESGQWSASGFLTGPYRVGASSPLLVGQANAEGVLSPEAPARTNVLLRFPPQAEVTGRLTGLVLDAQGTAISNAAVHIDFTPDYVISTDTEGRFDTQLRLPARTYRVVATNLVTGALAGASIDLVGGITNFVTLRMLDRGTARIRVLRANGQPAANAEVTLTRLQFPSPSTESAVTDAEGMAVLGDLWEGEWSVAATALEGVSRSHGLASLNLEPLRTNEVQVTLGASGTVTGTFVEANTGRPIEGAQVTLRFGSAIGAVAATAPTRAQGIFEIQGLPLGQYAVSARNPVNGRVGVTAVFLPSAEARVAVTLVEVPLGEVRGTVTRDGEPGGQPGIELKLRDDLGLAPEITVTSGPGGEYVFRGVPVGSFRLTAHDPERQLQATAKGGFAPAETMARQDMALPGVGAAEIRVLHPDGLTPAVGVAVEFPRGRERVASDTDAQGVARLSGLPLGQVEIVAVSRQAGESSSRARTNLILNAAGQVASATLILPGVGRVQGRVLDASGRPVASARLDLVPESGEWRGGPRQAVSERDGSFALDDLPLSAWTLKATVGGLAAQTGGRFLQAGETTTIELRLGPSGGIRGVIQDENGQEMRNLEVAFFFTAQSGSPAFARAVANGVGEFAVADLPVATPILLRVNVPAVDGIRTLLTNLPAGGGVLDVGVLRLDQHPPQLTASTPLPGAVEVATRPTLHLEFSEAIQPGSVSTNGVSLRYGDRSAPIRLALESGTSGPNSRLVIVPLEDLESATTYTLVVAGGDQVDASGRPISLGPEDLEGRPLPRTELLRFTVRDSRPPQLVAAYPEPQAQDIEPLATLRWEFDEPLRTNAVTATLSRNGTLIPATLALNANGRLLALVPNSPLLPDTTYQTRLVGVQDLAGNQAPERLGEFSTLDTRGPSLTTVRLRGGQRPVAKATVTVEALMDPPDPDAVVRWSRNGVALGISTNGPQHTFAVRLPAEGTVRITAVGVDRAGNAGEARVLELRVGPNDRPTVELARIEPLTGPLETGRRFGFSVLARDDATVSAVRLEGKGALSFTRTLFAPPNGVATPLVMEFPAEAEASGEVEISAVALDDSGASSDPAQLVFETLDTTPPRLQLSAPLDREVLDPRLPLALTLRASDNSRSLRWTVRLSGAVTAEQRQSWAPDPQQELAQSLVFSLTNALDGGSLTLTSILVDAAGNERAESRHYTLRSVLAPRIVRVVAADSGNLWDHAASTPISPWSSLVIGFDRVVDLTRSPSNRVNVTTLSGVVPPHEVRLTPSYAEVLFQGASLTPGDTLAVRVLPGWLGVNGQSVTLADGSDLPDAGALFDFNVAEVSGLSVTNNQPVVPGQWLTVAVHHDPAPWLWTLSVNGTPVPRQIPNVGRTEFWMQVPTNAASVVVQARSEHLGREPLLLPPVRFALRPRDADDDLDGLPNSWEADRTSNQFGTKFDPFNASDAAADFDFDGSVNRVEYRLGTDPFLADTDRDGLADGSESQVNGCPSPFDTDSDDDGIGDRDDLAPCVAGESIALTPLSLSAPEGEATTHTLTATAAGVTLLGMDFAPGTPRPAFISFADFTHTGTNPIVRRLLVRPSFADAGTHAFTIQVTARRNVSIVTTNLTLNLVVEDRSNEQHTRWARAADGDWGDAANWTAGLPGLGTNAVIDLPGTYAVRVTGTHFAESLILGAATGRQALRLEGGTLDLNGASAVLSNGRLVIERFGRLRGPGGLRVDGTFDLSNGTKEGAGPLRILPGGRFSISNTLSGITATLSSPVVNQGLISISTNSTLYLAGASLTNEVEGRILQAGGQLRGNYRES